jgi:hypothetical protein
MAEDIGIKEPVFAAEEISLAPPPVVAAAEKVAAAMAEVGGNIYQKNLQELVGTYAWARGVDIAVFFNSGGMGWNYFSKSPGWGSILDGITGQLREQGYTSVVFNYHRATKGLMGNLREIVEAASHYPRKAKDLAYRIRFLTGQLPKLKIIITGESTGTVISEETIARLKDTPGVYSIQTGVPFWYRSSKLDRTLRINNNGQVPDMFSLGSVPTMLWLNFKRLFGKTSAKEIRGDIFNFLKAPGHDYSWQYPGVSSGITDFLSKSFGTNR